MRIVKIGGIVAIVVALLVAVAATAFADEPTPSQGIGERYEAFMEKVAEKLGVGLEALRDAITKAMGETLDEAVEEGRISQEKADQLRQRLDEGRWAPFYPGRGWWGHPGFVRGVGASLDEVAELLGITRDEIVAQLKEDKSLLDIAQASGVDKEALIDALTSKARERVEQQVEAGKLTEEQGASITERLRERAEQMVEKKSSPGLRLGDRGSRFFGKGFRFKCNCTGVPAGSGQEG